MTAFAFRIRALGALAFLVAAAACSETVFEVIPVQTVEITGAASSTPLSLGQVVQLSAQLSGEGQSLSGRSVTWSSNNDQVATVDSEGRVTARSPGVVQITATAESVSGQVGLTVNAPVPAITSVSPTITPPNTAFTLTVLGTGFYSGSRISWNGTPRATTFVSATELRSSIAASDVATPGAVSITVVNPTPGGGTSAPSTLNVRPADPCQFFPPHTIPSTVTGRLEATDCRLTDNSFADIYTVTLAAPQQVTFTMTSSPLDSYLFLTEASSGRGVGFNDDTGASLNSTLRIMLAAGTYRLWANAATGQTGDYSLASQIGPANVTNCAEVWITPGLQTAGQTIATTDCRSADGFYSDDYRIFMNAGARVILTMNSTDFDAYLLISDSSGAVLAEDDDSAGGTNAQLTFTAPTQGFYRIEASTFDAGSVGAYTLVVQAP